MQERIIKKMIEAMHLRKGDKVLLNGWCEETDTGMKLFENCLKETGAFVYPVTFTDGYLTELVRDHPDGLKEEWFAPFSDTTAVIDLMEKPAGLPPEGLPRDSYPAFGQVLRSLFQFVSRHKKLIQITVPTRTNAMLAGQPYEKYRARMLKALDIDYQALEKACRSRIREYPGDRRVIHTGKDCVLEMYTAGREWQIDAGDGSFPCGEIYIAPEEEKTNGRIFFETLDLDGEKIFRNVTVTVRDGRVTESDCAELTRFLAGQEEGADIVGELGIGMNPNVEEVLGDSQVDEISLGTFHIALGMNNLFGGKNCCRFHKDFVTQGEII